MPITPTGDMFALNADRYNIYIASPYGQFILGKGLQSTDFSFDVPNEDVLEIGNEQQRGVLIKAAQYKGTLGSLLVDTDLIQQYTAKMGSVSTITNISGTSFSGGSKTIVNVVSPYNLASGTTSSGYRLLATGANTWKISGSSNTYTIPAVCTEISGLEICVTHSGGLVSGDICTFTGTKETSWNASDFKSSVLDFIVVARDNSTGDNIFKTDYCDGMIANSINIETSSDGMAMQSFETEGNSYVSHQGYTYRKVCYATPEDVVAGNIDLTSRIYTGSEAPVSGVATGSYSGKYFLKVTKTTAAGVKSTLTEVATNTVDGDYTYNAGTKVFTPYTAVAAGDRYAFTFYSLASGTSYDINYSNTSSPDVVDGRYVPVTYGSTKLETVSSANINIALNRERKTRQGFVNDYFTPAKVPVVTGDVSSMDGDLKLLKLLTKGSTGTSDTQFDYNEHGNYTNTTDVAYNITILNPADNITEIVKFDVAKVQLTGSSIPIAVGSDTARNFSWKAKDGNVAISRA